ncbi:MAG: imidazole glycerol phosphate synthase subunit HisH [Candidatus Niyogibacteria bacterium]|nr:MAG: imidazole glycerol phosphate synthase subunit HisH [Candidatus Niyogibacteria bacterium]
MIKPKITIIDYGVGNLHSLKKAFEHFGAEYKISEEAETILNSDAVVLPGVGAFEAGMRGLESRGLTGAVRDFAKSGKPMLGICLGAQILLSRGYEFGIFEGLDIIKGEVTKLPEIKDAKIPHIGWNKIYANVGDNWKGTVLNDIEENATVYFVHSYIFQPKDKSDILALSNYGGFEFCSAVRKGNIYGCQFHPEKSGENGLRIIENFINLV